MKESKLISIEFTPGENPEENLKFSTLLNDIVGINSNKIKFVLLKKEEPTVEILIKDKKNEVNTNNLERYLTPQESTLEFYYGTDELKSKEVLNKLLEYKNRNTANKLVIHKEPQVKIQGQIRTIVNFSELFLFYAIEKTKAETGGRASVEKVAQITKIDLYFNS